MKFKYLLKDIGFWFVVYSIIATATIIIMAVVWSHHECPKTTVLELEIEAQKQINTINNANNNHTIDSLFFELYGFYPNR